MSAPHMHVSIFQSTIKGNTMPDEATPVTHKSEFLLCHKYSHLSVTFVGGGQKGIEKASVFKYCQFVSKLIRILEVQEIGSEDK